MLQGFMGEFDLFSANISFMKPKGQFWTHEYPTSDRAKLYCILYRQKWRNSVRDERSYSSFHAIGSDHRIVPSNVKFSLRVSKMSKPYPMNL